ncbi:hypothetical protein [Helicobacter sp. 11S02596-1]|uniref:hypothetical protein n=1 Tax=Helicobacter sp. 11S02596-1 TaxID=1476194 RepID=UPI000BA7DC0C|nr:hypothetical protein [Helicobacter sp. 11S02596-1]
MLPSAHRGFASVELLMALVVMGVAFKVFWKIYEENERYHIFSQKSQKMFLAQKNISKALDFGGTQNAKSFVVLSQKGFRYEGKLLEERREEGLAYHYFYPQSISKNQAITDGKK